MLWKSIQQPSASLKEKDVNNLRCNRRYAALPLTIQLRRCCTKWISNLPPAEKLQELTWSAGASVIHLILLRRTMLLTSGATGGTPPSPWLFSSAGAEQNESQNLPPADKLQALTWSAGASANHLFLWRRIMLITSGETGGTDHPYDMQLRRCCTPMGNTFHLFLSRLFV